MKHYRLQFTEEEWIALENFIGEMPTKFGNPLINMLIPKLQETQIPEPPKPETECQS